ncbi:MAG: hypothetical protein H7831_18685 [Magnetococcus sp. WYHC-3]
MAKWQVGSINNQELTMGPTTNSFRILAVAAIAFLVGISLIVLDAQRMLGVCLLVGAPLVAISHILLVRIERANAKKQCINKEIDARQKANLEQLDERLKRS